MTKKIRAKRIFIPKRIVLDMKYLFIIFKKLGGSTLISYRKYVYKIRNSCFILLLLISIVLQTYGGVTSPQNEHVSTVEQYSSSPIDSLQLALKNCLNDSIKVDLLQTLGWELRTTLPTVALDYSNQALEIAKKHNYSSKLGSCIRNLGEINRTQGNFEIALEYFYKSLQIDEELMDKTGIASDFNNIGGIYYYQKNYEEAIRYFQKALAIKKEMNNLASAALSLDNIGSVHYTQGDYKKAQDYYLQSLEIQKSLNNLKGISSCYSNIANLNFSFAENQKDKDSVQKYILRSLDFDFRSLRIRKEIADKSGMVISWNNIGETYVENKSFNLALAYFDSSLQIAKELGLKYDIMQAVGNLANTYYFSKQFMLALKFRKLHSLYKDSIFNEEKSKEIGKVEARYEIDRKIKEENAQILAALFKTEAARSRRNNLQYSLIGIGLIILFTLVFFAGNFMPPNWVIELSTFIPFLLLFEFGLVYVDPYLELFTQGEPMYKLLINALLAGAIFPFHLFFEGLLKKRILNIRKHKLNMSDSLKHPKNGTNSSSKKIIVILFYLGASIFFALTNQNSAISRASNKYDSVVVEFDNNIKMNSVSKQKDSLQNSALNISLTHILTSTMDPQKKLDTILRICQKNLHSEPKLLLNYVDTALILAQKMDLKEKIGECYITMGDINWTLGFMDIAKENYLDALKQYEDIKNKYGIARSLGNVGNVLRVQSNYDQAISYYLKALKLKEGFKNKSSKSSILNNLGIVYYRQGNIDLAIENYKASLKIDEEVGNLKGVSSSLGNLGNAYQSQGKFRAALGHYQKSLQIEEELGNKPNIAGSLGNMAIIFSTLAEKQKSEDSSQIYYAKSIEFDLKALEISKEMGNQMGIAIAMNNIGESYASNKQYLMSLVYLRKCVHYSGENGYKFLSMNAYLNLAQVQENLNHYQEAYQQHQLYRSYKDSIFSEEKSREIGKMEVKYEMEKKIMEEKAAAESKEIEEKIILNRRNNLQYSGILIVIIILFTAVFFMGKFTLPKWLIELIIFIPFLLLFEFALVFIDPYVEGITDGEPLFKLLVNAIMAGVIFPLHLFFESRLKRRIMKVKRTKK